MNYVDSSGLIPKKFEYPKKGKLPGTNIPYRMDMRQEPYPNMHVWWKDGGETVVTHKGGWPKTHGGKTMTQPPMKYRPNLKPVVCDFMNRVRDKLRGGMGGVFFGLGLGSGLISDYGRWNEASNNSRTYEEQMCEDYGGAGPFINTTIGFLPNPYEGCSGT